MLKKQLRKYRGSENGGAKKAKKYSAVVAQPRRGAPSSAVGPASRRGIDLADHERPERSRESKGGYNRGS